jgi:hypothetical protein
MIKSVWYEFLPQTSGLVQVNTLGSDHDTVISAYTQGFGGQLNPLACSLPTSFANNPGFTLQANAFHPIFLMSTPEPTISAPC